MDENKLQVVGGVEMTKMQVNALIDLFRHSGWEQLKRILEVHRGVTVENLLGKNSERTLQDLGIAQGAYGTTGAILDLPEEASMAYWQFPK